MEVWRLSSTVTAARTRVPRASNLLAGRRLCAMCAGFYRTISIGSVQEADGPQLLTLSDLRTGFRADTGDGSVDAI